MLHFFTVFILYVCKQKWPILQGVVRKLVLNLNSMVSHYAASISVIGVFKFKFFHLVVLNLSLIAKRVVFTKFQSPV